MNPWVIASTAFLASGMEFVEAATIVLAVAATSGARVALSGTLWAVLALAVIVAVAGPALLTFVPLAVLKIAIGCFLVLFGYTWLRKAIWRFSGRKAAHDEGAIYAREVERLRAQARSGFFTAFNGVLLEGLEVAVIVITFAAARGSALFWAAGGAAVAGLLVVMAALALRRPLARVPENAMAYVVGIMLLSFGTFWSGEGLGLRWWKGEASLVWVVVCYLLASAATIGALRAAKPAHA